VDIKRKPSEYVKDHIKFTTQPLDYPRTRLSCPARSIMEADKILLYSSDYPHWTFDDPRWAGKHLPRRSAKRSCSANGIETYNFPEPFEPLMGPRARF